MVNRSQSIKEVKYARHSQAQGVSAGRPGLRLRPLRGLHGWRGRPGLLGGDRRRFNRDHRRSSGRPRGGWPLRGHHARVQGSAPDDPRVVPLPRLLLGAAALILSLWIFAVAPSRVEAFTGEGSVLNGAKTDLTSPAKSILTKPTFVTTNIGEASLLGGVAEESAAAGIFQSAGILPVLGSVVSFGVGTIIGSEICKVLGIEGCWYFHSDGADTAISPATGTWEYRESVPTVITEETKSGNPVPFAWYYKQSGSFGMRVYAGQGGAKTKSACNNHAASGAQIWLTGAPFGECPVGTEVKVTAPVRFSMENRTIEYHATDEGGIGNYSHTAPSNWSEKLASQLKGHEGDAAARLGQHIASEIDPEVKDPYVPYHDVPDCDGLKRTVCVDLLEELELVPNVTELDWDDAVIEELDILDPEKTREEEAERVIELAPPAGDEVKIGTEVDVLTNPDLEEMPYFVPAPDPGETEEEYKEKKIALPVWVPHSTELDDGTLDPSKGPSEVVRTYPEAGTRVDPSVETDLEIQFNPDTAPPVSAAWSAPAVSPLDLSPLTGIHVGCNDFPFGVFCWIAAGLTDWGSAGTCPSFGVPFVSEIRDAEDELVFDTCTFEPAMEIIRPMIVVLSFFGVAWLLAASAMGLGSGGSDD